MLSSFKYLLSYLYTKMKLFWNFEQIISWIYYYSNLLVFIIFFFANQFYNLIHHFP